MKHIKIKLITLCSLLILFGCSPITQERTIFTDFESFNELELIESIKLNEDVFAVGQMQMFKDWLVLTTYGGDTFLYAYNIKTGKDVKWLYNGRSGIETTNIRVISKINDSTLWADLDNEVVYVYNLNNLDSEDMVPIESYKLNLPQFNNSILANNQIVYATQNMDNNTTLYYCQSIDGSESKHFGEYPSEDKGLAEIPTHRYGRIMAYQGEMFKHPNKDLAYFSPDDAVGFDIIDTKKMEIDFRLYYKYPVMEITDSEHGYMVWPDSDSKIGFNETNFTEDYIYFLYSDRKHSEKSSEHPIYLLSYNWRGKPMNGFKLDRDIDYFSVSDDNKVLYAIYEDESDSDRMVLNLYKLN